MDPNSYLPNYNMGVLLCKDKAMMEQSLAYFNRALECAHEAGEFIYEMNVLNSISLLNEASGSLEAALEAQEMALKIDPGNTKIMKKIKELNEMHNNRL